jgi:RNA polymerase sigma-70 factor, ECF subfamily
MLPENPSGQTVLPEQTDAALVSALRMGHTQALGILYDRHAGLVYGIALKFLTAPESEDLTHDIFLQLAKATAYDPTRSSLRTFLAVLTRSRAIDRLRSQSRQAQRRQSAEIEAVGANLPLSDLLRREQSQAVRDALTQLSQEQQAVLKLIYYEGLNQPTIAERLNLPLTTVKSRARLGLLRLRQILDKLETV